MNDGNDLDDLVNLEFNADELTDDLIANLVEPASAPPAPAQITPPNFASSSSTLPVNNSSTTNRPAVPSTPTTTTTFVPTTPQQQQQIFSQFMFPTPTPLNTTATPTATTPNSSLLNPVLLHNLLQQNFLQQPGMASAQLGSQYLANLSTLLTNISGSAALLTPTGTPSTPTMSRSTSFPSLKPSINANFPVFTDFKDVTAKKVSNSPWPKEYTEVKLSMLVVHVQNFLSLRSVVSGDGTTEGKFKTCIQEKQVNQITIFSSTAGQKYIGYVLLPSDFQFLFYLSNTGAIRLQLEFEDIDRVVQLLSKGDDSSRNQRFAVYIKIFFTKEAFSTDSRQIELMVASATNNGMIELPETYDNETDTQKMHMRKMFEKLDKNSKEESAASASTRTFSEMNDSSSSSTTNGGTNVTLPISSSSNNLATNPSSSKLARGNSMRDVKDAKRIDDDDDLGSDLGDSDDDDDLDEYINVGSESEQVHKEHQQNELDQELENLISSVEEKVPADEVEGKSKKRSSFADPDMDEENLIEKPEGLVCDLRNYQRVALQWMLNREQKGQNVKEIKKLHPLFDEKKFPDGEVFYFAHHFGIVTFHFVQAPPDPKGGILADQMGLGKTVEVIALIVANPAEEKSYGKTKIKGKVRSKATLIVTPVSIVSQWKQQVELHTNPQLKVHNYHEKKVKDASKLVEFDVILTTYETLRSEFQKEKNESPLYNTVFHRIVLDEADKVKNRKSHTYKAVTMIDADRRWAVTGTPIQNHVDDLFSLFQFLRVSPHGDWRWWSRNVAKPFEKKETRKNALEVLQSIISEIMIRRTKDKEVNGVKILALPTKTNVLRQLEFSEAENILYRSLYAYCKKEFNEFVQTGTVTNNYTNILEMLTYLRQACCHPALLVRSLVKKKETSSSILKIFMQDFIKNNTKEVLDQLFPNLKLLVHKYLTEEDTPDVSKVDELLTANWRGSSKINSLVEQLQELKHVTKSVVFSQWTSMLDIVEIAMEKYGLHFTRLDGKMNTKARENALQIFKTDPKVSVCLISLKAGGVGLNLVWATHVFLMDPWWNPAAEAQAIDRVHRYGQNKDVTATRFVIKGSIEERVVDLQKTKHENAEDVLGGSGSGQISDSGFGLTKKDARQVKYEDLQRLFADDDDNDDSDNELDFDDV